MNTRGLGVLVVACDVLGASCSKGGTTAHPSALSVCLKLQSLALVTNCEPDRRGGLSAGARDKAQFNVENYLTGQVLTFETTADYDRTVAAFSSAAELTGPHR